MASNGVILYDYYESKETVPIPEKDNDYQKTKQHEYAHSYAWSPQSAYDSFDSIGDVLLLGLGLLICLASGGAYVPAF